MVRVRIGGIRGGNNDAGRDDDTPEEDTAVAETRVRKNLPARGKSWKRPTKPGRGPKLGVAFDEAGMNGARARREALTRGEPSGAAPAGV